MSKNIIIALTLSAIIVTLLFPQAANGQSVNLNKLDNNSFTHLTSPLNQSSDSLIIEYNKNLAAKSYLQPAVYAEAFVDTTGYDRIYRQAAKKYDVPWEVLSAVHYVETKRSGDSFIRSYAGAQGPMQFIPSTFRAYGTDGNGDNIAQINNVNDAIYSAANLLSHSGGKDNINRALLSYNHSYSYVNRVLSIAKSLGY
ncbi:MAG: lytic transglycosylase domain-containing protein [bacterium]